MADEKQYNKTNAQQLIELSAKLNKLNQSKIDSSGYLFREINLYKFQEESIPAVNIVPNSMKPFTFQSPNTVNDINAKLFNTAPDGIISNDLLFDSDPLAHIEAFNQDIIDFKTDNVTDIQSHLHSNCNLSECPQFRAIIDILKRHHIIQSQHKELNNNEKKKQETENSINIRNIYRDNYSNTKLLDDYNHLLTKHSQDFEDIYDKLIEETNNKQLCDLNKCKIIRRNQRDRSAVTKNENILTKLYECKNENDIVQQQFIDRIHSHYFHAFDTGYKLTIKEKTNILNKSIANTETKNNDDTENTYCKDINVSTVSTLLQSKRNKYRNMHELDRINAENSKFIMQTSKSDPNKPKTYSYGYRYFYWPYYKNNTSIYDNAHLYANMGGAPEANHSSTVGDWYIENKYKSFKNELLNNILAVIAESQWDNLMLKAAVFIQTWKVRQMKCPRTVSAKCYDMMRFCPMSKQHLIAVMVYCNFDVLQFKFGATFRRINEDETNESMKNRHRNFYFLGKLLRECTECFGLVVEGANNINLYHGVNENFLFSSIFACIKGPFSTTTAYSVAAIFCANAGMIVNMDINVNEWIYKWDEGESNVRISCFDCEWISDYPNEKEVFFIGGLGKFKFNTIIQASLGTNYEKYIKGLKQMTFFMSIGDARTFSGDIPETDEELQMVYRLLSHEIWRNEPNHELAIEFVSCPNYMKTILHLHAISITKLEYFDSINEDSKIHSFLFEYDNGWLKIDLIMTIFPNIKELTFDATNKDIQFLRQEFIYNSILSFIDENNGDTNLKNIEIKINSKYSNDLAGFIGLWKEKFKNHSWDIEINTVDASWKDIDKNVPKQDVALFDHDDFMADLFPEAENLFTTENTQMMEHQQQTNDVMIVIKAL
eukprot:305168_1